MNTNLIWEKETVRKDSQHKNRVILFCTALKTVTSARDVVRLRVATCSSFNRDGVCFPSVVFYGTDAVDAIRSIDLSKKPRVIIEGFIQTERKIRDGETKYFQDIIGLKISYAKTRIEDAFGVDGLGVAKALPRNEILLIGEVVNVYRFRNRQYGITIRAEHHNIYNFPMMISSRAFDEVNRSIRKGDTVAAVCEVSTYNSDQNGNTFPTREQILVKDIQIMDQK